MDDDDAACIQDPIASLSILIAVGSAWSPSHELMVVSITPRNGHQQRNPNVCDRYIFDHVIYLGFTPKKQASIMM